MIGTSQSSEGWKVSNIWLWYLLSLQFLNTFFWWKNVLFCGCYQQYSRWTEMLWIKYNKKMTQLKPKVALGEISNNTVNYHSIQFCRRLWFLVEVLVSLPCFGKHIRKHIINICALWSCICVTSGDLRKSFPQIKLYKNKSRILDLLWVNVVQKIMTGTTLNFLTHFHMCLGNFEDARPLRRWNVNESVALDNLDAGVGNPSM